MTLTEGARRLPASETALLSALEMPLVPIRAFLLLAQVPSGAAMVGGVIIMVALVWS